MQHPQAITQTITPITKPDHVKGRYPISKFTFKTPIRPFRVLNMHFLITLLTLFFFSSIVRADDNPCIMQWGIAEEYGFALQVTGGTPYTGQNLNPPVGTILVPSSGASYGYVIFNSLNMNIWAANGTPLGSITAKTKYVNSGDVPPPGIASGQNYPYSSGNFSESTYLQGATLQFTYNASKSTPGNDAWSERWWYDLSIFPAAFNIGPAVIPNAGWSNGLGNAESIGVSGLNFWGIDYGMDFIPNTSDPEDYRWYAENGAIWQSTKNIKGYGSGSRAYAVQLTQDATTGEWSATDGTGVAYDGCWQIDIKIGSNGTLNSLVGGAQTFCETFYLAERRALYPGVANYLDGSSAGGSGNNSQYGREIDIMETSWNGYGATTSTAPGPQVNLPNGNATGWLQDPQNGQNGVNQKAADWSAVGGAPTSDFVTFGVLIKDDQIWFYANKPNGDQWYSIGPIAKTNTAYQQEGKFVPYIGTWNNTNPSTSAPNGGFDTGYKNFVYVANSDAKIAGFNPKDHPEKFGSVLKPLTINSQKPISSTNTSLSNASTASDVRSVLNMKIQAVLAQGSAMERSASDVATILGVSKSNLAKALKLAPNGVKSGNGKIHLAKLSKFISKNFKAASLLKGKFKGKAKKSVAK
jgi:hypothetical protein